MNVQHFLEINAMEKWTVKRTKFKLWDFRKKIIMSGAYYTIDLSIVHGIIFILPCVILTLFKLWTKIVAKRQAEIISRQLNEELVKLVWKISQKKIIVWWKMPKLFSLNNVQNRFQVQLLFTWKFMQYLYKQRKKYVK